MKRVAERAGVSIATVSRVVNKSGFVAPSLQKVVMEAMEALRYQPSAVARGLRTRETRSIGVLVPQLSQPFFSSLAYAIERTLFSHGYRAFLCSAEEDAAEESAYIDMLLSQRVDGLILVTYGPKHGERSPSSPGKGLRSTCGPGSSNAQDRSRSER
jgi:LacI family transcriptional regulator